MRRTYRNPGNSGPPTRSGPPLMTDGYDNFYEMGSWDESHTARIVEIATEQSVSLDAALTVLASEIDEYRDGWIDQNEGEIAQFAPMSEHEAFGAWRDGYMAASTAHVAHAPKQNSAGRAGKLEAAAGAIEKFREFHRFEPKKVVDLPELVIP